MKILDKPITKIDLFKDSQVVFDATMVKGVVDIRQEILAVDAELHADLEKFLLENGSLQEDLWGIDLWDEAENDEDFIEFDSMINIRPRQNNRSRYVEDERIREKIIAVVKKWIL